MGFKPATGFVPAGAGDGEVAIRLHRGAIVVGDTLEVDTGGRAGGRVFAMGDAMIHPASVRGPALSAGCESGV